ncbi:MAG: hypothetical protein ABF811_06085 [Pseudoclavibacter sp.]
MSTRDRGHRRSRAAAAIVVAGSSVLALAVFGHILNVGTGASTADHTTPSATTDGSGGSDAGAQDSTGSTSNGTEGSQTDSGQPYVGSGGGSGSGSGTTGQSSGS